MNFVITPDANLLGNSDVIVIVEFQVNAAADG